MSRTITACAGPPLRCRTFGCRTWTACESALDERLSVRLLRRLADETRIPAPPTGPQLTPREREVLGLVAEGKTNAAIAQSLFVSVGTVKVNVERIIDKLGVSDRTQAAVRAIELGLITRPPSTRPS